MLDGIKSTTINNKDIAHNSSGNNNIIGTIQCSSYSQPQPQQQQQEDRTLGDMDTDDQVNLKKETTIARLIHLNSNFISILDLFAARHKEITFSSWRTALKVANMQKWTDYFISTKKRWTRCLTHPRLLLQKGWMLKLPTC